MFSRFKENDEVICCYGGKPSKFWDDRDSFKSKSEFPYSYDPICIWGDEYADNNGSIYTDRLLHWDFPKHDELCMKHFGDKGQYWNNRDPNKIEAFLRDWVDDQELELIYITEFCNLSNGYPTWLLAFKHG